MPSSAIRRRSFLQVCGATLAAPLAASGPVIYSGQFVPPGAACKVAFVSDHHYWPNHTENWGNGAQITTNTDRRMPDLAAALNAEQPALSIHGGDVISAGGSFFPPPEEYTRQLAFADDFYLRLKHRYLPMLGNHETAEPYYENERQLDTWTRHFGPPYRHRDVSGWRFIGLNSLLPNPDVRYGKGNVYRNVFGLDPQQMTWLGERLAEARSRNLHVVLCTHVPPAGWVNCKEFEQLIASAGCVRAVICGHEHRNTVHQLGGVPVLVRSANVSSPFGYTMLHGYPDGRLISVQKSQHFPMDDFISSRIAGPAPLGAESDRFLTLGGASVLPLDGLKVVGAGAEAVIRDGHLRLASSSGRALVLINAAAMSDARLSLTIIKSQGERFGAIALADANGAGIEAALTARYSPEAKVYLARSDGQRRDVLARTWFNIADNIAYHCTLETRGGRLSVNWKNMTTLETTVDSTAPGYFGFFVDHGTMLVTDMVLERLA